MFIITVFFCLFLSKLSIGEPEKGMYLSTQNNKKNYKKKNKNYISSKWYYLNFSTGMCFKYAQKKSKHDVCVKSLRDCRLHLILWLGVCPFVRWWCGLSYTMHRVVSRHSDIWASCRIRSRGPSGMPIFCSLSSPRYGSSIIPTRSFSKMEAYFWKYFFLFYMF